jgi:cell division protein FtsQ
MVQLLLNRFTLFEFNNIQLNNRIAYLINTLSISLLLLSGIYFAIHHWFNVQKIIIEGDIKHVTPTQLTYVANNKLHGTFFTLNIEELKEQFEELPWVKSVVLERQFPHTIIVHLNEYKAVARVGDEDLLASDGKVFDGADDDMSLPILYVDASDAVDYWAKYNQIESIAAKHNAHITSLRVSDSRIIVAETSTNVKITFCEQNLAGKLLELDKYWEQLYSISPKLSSINFCYKNAVAIDASH